MEKTNKPTRRRVANNATVRFFLQTNCAQGYPVAQAKSKLFLRSMLMFTLFSGKAAPRIESILVIFLTNLIGLSCNSEQEYHAFNN
jgi:hypothetical protein